jgi:tetrachlorobenzoquinone reductase
VSKRLQVRVGAIRNETADIRILELQAVEGGLPAFTAGSHIDMHLSPGLIRSYSLLNSQSETHRYVVGVALEVQSRGGSRHIHESLRVGDALTISEPRNLFPVTETACESVLIGGGIGITPMLSMANRLAALERSWKLHYLTRSRKAAGFLGDLALHGDRVELRFDDEQQGFLDMSALIAGTPEAHFYCCGPKPMMAAFVAAAQAQGVPSERVHIEYFQPPTDAEPQGGFDVELARTKRVLKIAPGKSILETLHEHGVATPSSCEAGICGECQVNVLAGVPDHKDHVLSDCERAANKVMMICCSGSRSGRLVLDL